MARHNYVMLYGQVKGKPKIYMTKEGVPSRAMSALVVIRGIRDAGDNIRELKYDCPVIMSGNHAMIEQMSKWNENDMVEIKGSVTTRDIKKSTKCPECGEVSSSDGNVVFINPIYIGLRETGVNKKEGQELLKKRCEISNIAILVGNLCREPETILTPKGTPVTQYQLAVSRKFHIKEDRADIKVDYPWVKSFGELARMDAASLSKGSMVLVDGTIQTRSVQRRTTCESCDHEYTWNDSAFEIVPYAVEYLQKFKLPEDIEAEEDEKNAVVANDVLG